MISWRRIMAGFGALLLLAAAPSAAQAQPSAPACVAGLLIATAGWQGAGGALAGAVRVTNDGVAACALGGPPTVQVLDSAGAALPITQTAWPGAAASAAVLAPGAAATADFAWRNWCAAAPAGPFTLEITLAHAGGSLRAPAIDPVGSLQGDTPRCDDAAAASTIAVDGFAASAGAAAGTASLPDTGAGPEPGAAEGEAVMLAMAVVLAAGGWGLRRAGFRRRSPR